MPAPHRETHRSNRIGWLRAAVLGANDGAVSVASVVVGVAAASGTTPTTILLAGVAATVAGAMSMAAGEYVSVQSQVDTEKADLAVERRELERDPEGELEELAAIYVSRGLDAPLARRVAEQLTTHDALGAHTRDELGITETLRARPLQAALSSAGAFTVGALIPLLAALIVPNAYAILGVGAATLIALMLLGGLAGFAGGASIFRGALRVMLWGCCHGSYGGCRLIFRRVVLTRSTVLGVPARHVAERPSHSCFWTRAHRPESLNTLTF